MMLNKLKKPKLLAVRRVEQSSDMGKRLNGWNFSCWHSCKSSTMLLYFTLLFVSIFPHSVVCNLRYYVCSNETTYDSRFLYNLHTVVDNLLRNTPRTGFNTSIYGNAPYKVYGLLQCWGNVSPQNCADCLKEANSLARDLCSINMGAQVWTDRCSLHYDISNFFSKFDKSGGSIANSGDITTDVNAFKNTTANLLDNLCHKAFDPANKGFAMGSLNYSATNKVYGRAQCFRDISIQDCKSCLSIALQNLKDCCSQKQGAQVLLATCTIRYETFPFFNPSESPSYDEPPSAGASNRKSTKNLPIILGVLGGVFLVLAVSLFGMPTELRSAIFRPLIAFVRRNREMHTQDPDSNLLEKEGGHIFGLKTLREATENFHDKNKLGEGGFGPVYKGSIGDGNEIAVKKLSAVSKQGRKEFMNEVKLVANVQHRNLVKLLGCCAEGAERLLVYEFLQNKSLDTFIFHADPGKRGQLDWGKRYDIIIGIARGLLYLHEDSQIRIIHRDIKANNILLDEHLHPKIADFGLARLFPDNETFVQTRVAGTYGYMAPEYAMLGHLSLKADVYSFGVLLLEIVSGRRNTDVNLPGELQSLVEWAWKLYKGGNLLNMVDPTVRESSSEEQALRCIRVGLLCVQSDATVRPHISSVITMMSSDSVVLPNPTKPAFVSVSRVHESTSSSVTGFQPYRYQRETSSATTSRTIGSSSNMVMVSSIGSDFITELEPR